MLWTRRLLLNNRRFEDRHDTQTTRKCPTDEKRTTADAAVLACIASHEMRRQRRFDLASPIQLRVCVMNTHRILMNMYL